MNNNYEESKKILTKEQEENKKIKIKLLEKQEQTKQELQTVINGGLMIQGALNHILAMEDKQKAELENKIKESEKVVVPEVEVEKK